MRKTTYTESAHTADTTQPPDASRATNGLPKRLITAFEVAEFLGFADANGMDLGVVRRDPVGGAHVAFKCDNHATVDAFYEAALAAGGKDNGPPGIRAHYHEHYYGAFVHDADGNNIEAVCQKPV